METKLTLRFHDQFIKRAKIYHHKKKTSLSKMIQSHFGAITQQRKDAEETAISLLVESLIGVIDLPAA
ncbi:DUF6364 family protein [Lunatimonas sp.]|uniref:DUF6364 family protein n=1 Tax=Lunatimonas sp. TaxID=2060141 RepID=UPI00263B5ABD|nr:DUF6364 family protein [Lunatimonas sp.]